MGQPADLVTVLIPARNEAGTIARCLESVLAQDYTHLQVVVVDGESTDGTRDVVQDVIARDHRVEMVSDGRRSIPAALNTGLAHARGRWLVRVDGHSTIPPDYVGLAVHRLREGRWAGVGGRKDGVGRTAAGRAIAAALGSRFGVGGSTYHHGRWERAVDHVPFGAYPVDLLREMGGWDERLSANEDFELDFRLGLAGRELLFDPALRIDWDCRQSVGDLWKQYHRYGRGKADVAVLHPASLKPRHVLPPALVGYLGLAAVVATGRPGTAARMVLPYAGVLAVATVLTGRRLRPGERRYVAPALAAMHVGWGSGFLAELPRSLTRMRTERQPSQLSTDEPDEAVVA
jgi:cellulose synthase/poly-beta-1,6-N-acetylglucosamine synthase-like glycosyltransferase